MNKKDKTAIIVSMLYPLLLLLVLALESPFSFYMYIILGIVLCIYWALRFIKRDTSSLNKVKSNDQESSSVVDELLKWNDLKDNGAITEAEYQQEKIRLLNRDK